METNDRNQEIRSKLNLPELGVIGPEMFKDYVLDRQQGVLNVDTFEQTKLAAPVHQEACRANEQYERLVGQVVADYKQYEAESGPKLNELDGQIDVTTTALRTATNEYNQARAVLR